MSNAVQISAHSVAENLEWVATQALADQTFPKFSSSRPLTPTEEATLLVDPRFVDLSATAFALEGGIQPYVPDATVDTFSGPDGGVPGTETMIFVPLIENGDPGLVVGAIYLESLGVVDTLGVALVMGRDDLDPHIMMYGPSGSGVNAVKLLFTSDHENIGLQFLSLDAGPGGQGEISWEEIKKWLSSDSPAEDIPWWIDIIAGASWVDAAIGSHNPLSISLCVHFLGAYMVACFYDGVPSNPT